MALDKKKKRGSLEELVRKENMIDMKIQLE